MSHYELIARIIRYLDQHYSCQPSLAVLARSAGLSRFHFHRLFTEWAGVTPKDFLQVVTISQAAGMLRRGDSVFDAALAAGLSGPGRLHDLCVSLDAASPGELKSGGAGLTIAAGFGSTPFGTCLLGKSARGICHLSFVENSRAEAMAALRLDWPAATILRDDENAERLAREIFAPAAKAGTRPALRAFVRGTPFQVRVWRALLKIPSGTLVSYGDLAATLGEHKAARAVGNAVARNSLACIIPCHRVIRETGAFGDYRWGPLRKRIIVAWERLHADGNMNQMVRGKPAGVSCS